MRDASRSVEGIGGAGSPPAGLADEFRRRWSAARAVMVDHDVRALVAVCSGTPHGRGWMRYFTGANIWGPRVFLVLPRQPSEAIVITRSPDDAEWLKRTVVGARVESTLLQRVPPVRGLIDALDGAGRFGGRVGFLNMAALTVDEVLALRDVRPEATWVDLTEEVNRLRQIKSPLEIAAMRETGDLLARALDVVGERARPGAKLLGVLGEAEELLRAAGCELGQFYTALNGRASSVAPSADLRLGPEDVLHVRLKYAGPLGYWHELAGVFAFRPLAAGLAACLRASIEAFDEAVRHLVPGASYARLSAAVDATFAACGFVVTGKRRVDCHTIGTDESEGSFPPAGDWAVREGMALAVHPGTLLAGAMGFSLDQTFAVAAAGAVPLSPSRSHPWGAA